MKHYIFREQTLLMSWCGIEFQSVKGKPSCFVAGESFSEALVKAAPIKDLSRLEASLLQFIKSRNLEILFDKSTNALAVKNLREFHSELFMRVVVLLVRRSRFFYREELFDAHERPRILLIFVNLRKRLNLQWTNLKLVNRVVGSVPLDCHPETVRSLLVEGLSIELP